MISNGAMQIVETTNDTVEAIVREHARLVYRIAYSVLRNHHDAEDATQETFLRVIRFRRKLEAVREDKAWLARIAWRVAIQKGKKSSEISISVADVNAAIVQLQSQLPSAEESALGKEMRVLLESLISALPGSLRDAIRLSTVEELTPGEMAHVLGTTESSVRSRIFRGRQILKQKLAELEGRYGTQR